jgi:creatinine deaminase
VTQEVLNTIAHLPTKSLATIVEDGFFKKLTDRTSCVSESCWRSKGIGEGGSPIGGVIIDDETRKIVGKGHNTLVQENHPYNHGETSAARDAGRLDFGKTTMFTTLTPVRNLRDPDLHAPVQEGGRRRRHQCFRDRADDA